MRNREPTHPEDAASRFWCGSRVSHPPAAFRLPNPSGHFQAGNAPGVFLFEAFPSRGAAAPLDARCPLAVIRARRSSDASAAIRVATNPTSGPCSPRESVAKERGLAVQPLDAPLRFCAPGLPGTALRTASRPLPSRALRRSHSRGPAVASQGIDPPCGAASFQTPRPSCDLHTCFPLHSLHAESFRACADRPGGIAAPAADPGNVRGAPGGRAEGMSVSGTRVVIRPSRAVYPARRDPVKLLRWNEL